MRRVVKKIKMNLRAKKRFKKDVCNSRELDFDSLKACFFFFFFFFWLWLGEQASAHQFEEQIKHDCKLNCIFYQLVLHCICASKVSFVERFCRAMFVMHCGL